MLIVNANKFEGPALPVNCNAADKSEKRFRDFFLISYANFFIVSQVNYCDALDAWLILRKTTK